MKTYKHYLDSGNGWIAVPFRELIRHNLFFKISCQSFQYKDMVYLDDEHDAPLFVNAVGLDQIQIKPIDHGYGSHIRTFQPFQRKYYLIDIPSQNKTELILYDKHFRSRCNILSYRNTFYETCTRE